MTAPPDGLTISRSGAPTHVLGLSSGVSRWVQAQYWGAPGGRRRDRRPYGRPMQTATVRTWLDDVHWPGPELNAAAFDTRVGGRLAGGAATAIARRLSHRGVRLVGSPAAFRVVSVTGPLAPGELARAADWAAGLAAAG
jgi:hypothetical protein